ncbi:MAG: DNA methyltransferase [Gammaproteobacteria bacterium]
MGSRLPPPETWEQLRELLDLDTTYDEAMTVEVGDNVFRNHPLGRNPGDLMSVPVGRSSNGHFATMPLALAAQTLKATLPSDGVCLDPFMGTGTTGRAALALGGRFIGVDVNAGYMHEFIKLAIEPPLPFPSNR